MTRRTARQEAQRARARRSRRLLATLTGAALVSTVVATAPAQADATTLGRSIDTAAVSCWDVKQQDPSAPDGSYWLLTPAMAAPQQFHCDMTTDGGGWVLVGRGRDGWKFTNAGQGTAEQVRSVVTGPGAFQPRTLSGSVIDGLLAGGRVDQLDDGVRLRRAADAAGTSWQEVRFDLRTRDRWSWSFAAEHPLDTYRFGTRTGFGGNTREFGIDQLYQRVQTTERDTHGFSAGWGYGSSLRGTSSATSHVWSRTTEGNALPFTQVYLRPRLTAAGTPFPAIPDDGLPASAQRPLLSNLAEPGEWGVTGFGNGKNGELNTEVQAFAQSGDRMIVGGNFRYVQKGAAASGADKVEQPFLAAFDVASGAWLPDFRPVLDGQVKDLQTLPDGRIVAAGEFRTVNGAPAIGLVAVDPLTGATDPTFAVAIEDRVTNSPGASVQALDVEGPWLYLAGRFTHLTGGTRPYAAYARNAARIAVASSTPDQTWNPNLNGTVMDIDASSRGDRLYAAGHFTRSNGASAPQVAVLSTAPGAALVPDLGAPSFSATKRYQQAVLEVGDRVWHGGSEHMLFSYTRDAFTRLSGNITKQGGDFQALASHDGVIYGGCHCGHFNYSGAYTWSSSSLPPTWTQGDAIRFVGAWDATTGEYLPEFVPGVDAARGHGPWELVTDSRGTMWMGGDFDTAQTVGERWQWAGGFVRFSPRDSVAPSSPGTLSGGDDGNGTTNLAWGTSTDDRGAVTYEVLRNDRVVATTWASQLSLPTVQGAARYFVRAVDAAGNRSATTTVRTVEPAPTPPPTEPLPYTVLAKWSGDGDTFDGATGTPAVTETGGSYGERLRFTQQPGQPSFRNWTGRRLGASREAGTVRWVSEFSAWPSASFVIAHGYDDSAGFAQRWRLDLTAAGRLRIRDAANVQTAESPTPLPLGTELRFEAVRNGTTMTVTVYAAGSTTPLLSLTGAVGTGVNHIRIGQSLSTPTVPSFTVDEVVVTDHAGEVGPVTG